MYKPIHKKHCVTSTPNNYSNKNHKYLGNNSKTDFNSENKTILPQDRRK